MPRKISTFKPRSGQRKSNGEHGSFGNDRSGKSSGCRFLVTINVKRRCVAIALFFGQTYKALRHVDSKSKTTCRPQWECGVGDDYDCESSGSVWAPPRRHSLQNRVLQSWVIRPETLVCNCMVFFLFFFCHYYNTFQKVILLYIME